MERKAVEHVVTEITDRTMAGFVSVFGIIDDGGDKIWPGAFAKTIKERGPEGAERIRWLWQHDNWEPPIAVIRSLEEVAKADLPKDLIRRWPDVDGALLVKREYLETPRGDEILKGIVAGAIRESSIGYDAVKFDFEELPTGETRPNSWWDGKVRNLREIRLWDISDVNWGMNPATMNLKTVVPFRDYGTAPENTPWDGPTVGDDIEKLVKMCAWHADKPVEELTKADCKLPHHRASDMKAVWGGVTAAMGALLGARGGVDIPEGERRGVYNHLKRHYEQFEKEPPDFKLLELAGALREVISTADILDQETDVWRAIQELDAALKGLVAAEPPTRALTALRLRMAIAERLNS